MAKKARSTGKVITIRVVMPTAKRSTGRRKRTTRRKRYQFLLNNCEIALSNKTKVFIIRIHPFIIALANLASM